MFCLNVLPIVVPTARRLKAQSSLQRPRLLSPAGRFHHFHAFQGFQGGVGRAQKANLESVEKWSSWTPKTGPRNLVPKSILNTLEIVESVEKWSSWSPKTSSRNGAVKPQHGKAGKAGGLVSRSFVFPRFPRFPRCSKSILEPGSSGLFLVSRSSIFPRFPRFPCCSEFTFEPCSSSRVLVSRSSIFPRFPCCSEFTFEPCSSRLAFWALPTPPWKPWKAWKWWKRLARQRGRRSRADGFFCGLVVDATTRSDTTRRWGQTTDLSARLADSASRPNGQLTRAGQFYHSITGRCPWRCDSCGTSIARREPASESRQPSPSVARPSQSLQPRGALQPKQVAPHSRCSPPGPSQWLQPQMPSAALSPAAPHSRCSLKGLTAPLQSWGEDRAGEDPGEDRGAGATTTRRPPGRDDDQPTTGAAGEDSGEDR